MEQLVLLLRTSAAYVNGWGFFDDSCNKTAAEAATSCKSCHQPNMQGLIKGGFLAFQQAAEFCCVYMQLLSPVSGDFRLVSVTVSCAVDASMCAAPPDYCTPQLMCCNCAQRAHRLHAQVCAVWAVLPRHRAGVVGGRPRVGLQDRRRPRRHQALQVCS
jgi:hypothetical protein